MISKKCFLICALFVTQLVSAGIYKCNLGDVRTPCSNTGLRFGGDVLWVQPNGNLENEFGRGTQTWNHSANLGFRIEGDYHFSYSNDFNVNWVYFKQTAGLVDTSGSIYNVTDLSFDSTPMVTIVNLELGQEIDVGEKWNIRMHMGLQVDKLMSELQATNGARDTLTFNMVGARAGIDTAYLLGDYFALYTNAALGALYSNSFISGGPNGGYANVGNVNTTALNVNGNVVSVDYNIGVSYKQSSYYGDWFTRVGWVNYTWVDGTQSSLRRPIPSLQGMILGLKWVEA